MERALPVAKSRRKGATERSPAIQLPRLLNRSSTETAVLLRPKESAQLPDARGVAQLPQRQDLDLRTRAYLVKKLS
jgi:hypothetical protein